MIGHAWVKRLFIDKKYRSDPDNPEATENPDDYLFIPATVDDNKFLMESSPGYVRNLAQMPEDLRRAYRYGDWDAIEGGSYFNEFNEKLHTCASFKIPDNWKRYRSFDYGLDKFACFWWAVDEDGRAWCYREYCRSGLIVQDAAQAIREHTLPGENIVTTYAPPDMWNRQKDTGRTMAELFISNGIPITKSDNNRVQGHMMIKEMLAPTKLKDPFVRKMYEASGNVPETLPGMIFFKNCKEVLEDLPAIQHDDNNPNDCAKEPHEVTHTCVTGDTLIATPHGDIPISELKEGECYAWDGEKVVTARNSDSVITNLCADVYEITLDTGEIIKATAEHPVLTMAGWKTVGELTVRDDILTVPI